MDKNKKQLTHDEHLELELLRILVSDALESVKAQQIMEIIKRERQNERNRTEKVQTRSWLRSAQQLAEASGYKAQTLLAMECGSRNESVSLSNVKHCLDWTLDENIMTVANLFVEGKI